MGGSGRQREREDLFESILSVSKITSQVAKGSQSWQLDDRQCGSASLFLSSTLIFVLHFVDSKSNGGNQSIE